MGTGCKPAPAATPQKKRNAEGTQTKIPRQPKPNSRKNKKYHQPQ
jgi:hypothetical protein